VSHSATRSNYVVKIQAMWQTGALPREVGVHQVSVYHGNLARTCVTPTRK
jgi:hypothetical protein